MANNIPLFLVYFVQILIELAVPIFLAVYLIKKYPNAWIMIVTGVFTFSIAQLVSIPAMNGINLLFNNGTLPTPSAKFSPYVFAAIVGLLAAITEEGLRWVGFRLTRDYAGPFRSGIGQGVGHGGAELLIYAALLAFSVAPMVFFNPGHLLNSGASMATVQTKINTIAAFWTNPWWPQFLDLLEKLIKFSAQIVFALLVWRSVTKDSPIWFIAALVYHAVYAGIPTLLTNIGWTTMQTKLISALFLLLNVFVIYWFWTNNDGLDSEGEEKDEDDEDEDEEDDRGAKVTREKKITTAAQKAAALKKKAAGKKPAAKKPVAKKPVAKTK